MQQQCKAIEREAEAFWQKEIMAYQAESDDTAMAQGHEFMKAYLAIMRNESECAQQGTQIEVLRERGRIFRLRRREFKR